MKILIVGGGVAGPAFAGFMKDHAEITLIDKAPQWGNIGYAIILWANGQQMLQKLGLDQTALKFAYQIPWNAIEDNTGKILKAFSFDTFRSSFSPSFIVGRTTLQQALTKNIEGSVRLKLGTTPTNITQDANFATVIFSDGTTDTFDLVVGADGIHSQIREMVFGKNFLKYYNWTVYAFWVPKGISSPKGAIEMSGSGKMVLIYPLEDRAAVMFGVATDAEPIDRNENSKETLRHLFSGFNTSVNHIIDSIEKDEHIFKDNLAHVDMNDWYHGRVVLMGDAQHASSTITGMGASLALEDAFVLSEEIKKLKGKDIAIALQAYAKRRTRRIKNFRKSSDVIERWMLTKSPFLTAVRNTIIKIIPMKYFLGKIENLVREEI